MRKKFFIIFFFFFISSYSVLYSKIQNNIILKVENEIITQYEIKNKILSTLILSNQDINQENINKLKKQALEFLIQLKLKKIELSKHKIQKNSDQVTAYLQSISSNNIEELKKKFENNNLDFGIFIEEIEIETKWRTFVYKMYSRKIKIDEAIINQEIKNYIQNKKDITEYRLSEVEVATENNKNINDKILEIQDLIRKQGFENVAFNFSTSTSSQNKGDLGWINAKSLSKEIIKIVEKMDIGDISQPIKKQSSLLFLKLTDKKISKSEDINITKLQKNLIDQKKNELFNLYSRSHISKLKNTSLIEYQ